MTLDKFITCICDKDYSVLVLPGCTATIDQQINAWQNIYEQYVDCIQDTEQQYLLRLSNEINLLYTKLNLINLIVDRLNIQHNAEVLEELKKILYVPGNFDANDREAYQKDLDRIVTLSKRLYVQLKEKEGEYEKLMPTEKAGKIERTHFDTLLIQLSKHMKFQINRREIMVSEFVAMMADLRTTVKHLQVKNNKKI